jgi:hypothetical protein
MRKVPSLILCALILVSSYALEAAPKLVLHFDVNKTLTAIDTAKYGDVVVKEGDELVFASFYKLIAFMDKQGMEYSIVLRTFGKDLRTVVNEIEAKTNKVFFEQYPKFVSGKLHVDDAVLSSPKEIYSYFSTSRHIAVQDEYSWWASHGKTTRYGKPFYVNLQDENTIHVFFDDNISTNDEDPSIVASLDAVSGEQLSARKLSEKGFLYEVDPSDAEQNENYYIEKVIPIVIQKI